MMKCKIIKIRLAEEFIEADQKQLDWFLNHNNVLKYDTAFVKEHESYWSVILYYEAFNLEVQKDQPVKNTPDSATLTAAEEKILEALKLWRTKKAKTRNLPVYLIASNKELCSIAKSKPARREDLSEIKGFGKFKLENYGEEIIELLEMA